jgi:hypothetical protein
VTLCFQDEPLSRFGFWADWTVAPKWNLCNAPGSDNGGKVKAVGAFLESDDKAGEMFSNAQGRTDARLRVIFDNGTESNLLMRSLQRALHKDEAGRRITDPTAGPLFATETEEGDLASGVVYVLRSKSDDPYVAEHRNVLHKVGVTGGDVTRRLANARLDPTFLMADVEVVATYELFNINRTRLENLIHRVFGSARLEPFAASGAVLRSASGRGPV